MTHRLDDLLLARIATLEKAPPIAALARELRPLAPASFDDARWAREVDAACQRLTAAGLLDDRRRAPGGLAEAARRLGAGSTITWKRLVERTLPGLALDVAPGDSRSHDRLDGRDAWAAAIVARALGIWRQGPPPSLPALCDAVVWRALGLAGTPKRTPAELRAHFLGPLLPGGVSAGSPDRAVRLLAASQVGAPRADLRALRQALVRRWLEGVRWDGAAAAKPAATAISRFAEAVGDAADRATDGRFGDRKVFIRSVWRALRDDPSYADLPLDDFKHRLVDAHKAGLVSLVRADLVAAMDPALVRESETAHLEARYHFVERRPS